MTGFIVFINVIAVVCIIVQMFIMKKLFLFLFISVALVSCGTAERARIVDVFLLDFSRYSEMGFLLTSDSYNGEYDSIGEMTISITPGYFKETVTPSDKDGIYANNKSSKLVRERISYQELADIAVENAMKNGADVLSNFKITPVTAYDKYLKTTYISFYNVTGLCLKRK